MECSTKEKHIEYEDDFGINARLKVKILKSGLEIGGKFENHKKTAYKIAGKLNIIK